MEFTVKVEINAAPELLNAITGIADALTGQTGAPKQQASAKVKSKEAKIVKQEPVQEQKTEQQETVQAPSTESTTDEPTITIEQVRAAVKGKATAGKRDEVKKLLGEFGVPNVTSLEKSQFGEFFEKVEAL